MHASSLLPVGFLYGINIVSFYLEETIMNQYVTSSIIKELREERKMTQAELAQSLSISDKTVSKWETGRGLPDIALIEPLAKVLNVSVSELISGTTVKNSNISANMLRSKFYVCPVCGNVIHSTGEAVHTCHGIELCPLEAALHFFYSCCRFR